MRISDWSSDVCSSDLWEDCDRLHREVSERWGGAQILVNNAGTSPLAPSSLATSQALFDKIIATNLRSVFRLCALFGAQIREAVDGGIVNISSSGALRPDPRLAPSYAARNGVHVPLSEVPEEQGTNE